MEWVVWIWDSGRWCIDTAFRWHQDALWRQRYVEYTLGKPARIKLESGPPGAPYSIAREQYLQAWYQKRRLR